MIHPKKLLIAAAVMIGLLRPLFIIPSPNRHVNTSYQALAHIVVGLTLAVWFFTGDRDVKRTFWVLVAVELVCAAITVAIRT